jgi:hypothetical protein
VITGEGGPRRRGGPVLSKWPGRDRNISSVVPSCATECSRLRACRVGVRAGEGPGWLRLRPPFSGASSVFTRALIGVPGEGLACSGGGDRGGDGGGENSPRPRAGPRNRSPSPLVTVRATVAVPERTGNTRPTRLRGLGRAVGAVSAPATPMTTATRRADHDRPRGRPQCTGSLRAQARKSRTVHGRFPRCLPPAPGKAAPGKAGIGAVGGMSRCGPSGYGGPMAGTLTGATPATVLVKAHYPGALPR